jgi:hypothetical protein
MKREHERFSVAKTRGSPEFQAFNNVTDLLRKLLISQAIIILARDNDAVAVTIRSEEECGGST